MSLSKENPEGLQAASVAEKQSLHHESFWVHAWKNTNFYCSRKNNAQPMKLSGYNPEGMQIATGCDMQLGIGFLVAESHILVQKKEEKKDDSNVATAMTHLQVGLSS